MFSFAGSLFWSLLHLAPWIGHVQVDEPPREQLGPEVRGRLLDVEGNVLPPGEVIRGYIQSFFVPLSEADAFLAVNAHSPRVSRLEIGADGVFVLPINHPWDLLYNDNWLHLARIHESGLRERVFLPARNEMGTVTLERETRLARIRAIDELGEAVFEHGWNLSIQGPGTSGRQLASERLGQRLRRIGGALEVWGFASAGVGYNIVPRYGSGGLVGPPIALPLDDSEVTAVLPATGGLQLRVRVPRPFPADCLRYVVEDVERGLRYVGRPIPNDTTNRRLLLGPHRVHFEFNGMPLAEPELVEIAHATHLRFPVLDLSERVQVFAIEVLAPNGTQLPRARVRLAGSSHPGAVRKRLGVSSWPILMATLGEPLDLEVFDLDGNFVPQILTGVDGDRMVVLEPAVR